MAGTCASRLSPQRPLQMLKQMSGFNAGKVSISERLPSRKVADARRASRAATMAFTVMSESRSSQASLGMPA